MAKLIFYKAQAGNWFDKLVSWADKGIYSHVEIVLSESSTHWITVASSNRDGGVRVGLIRKSDHWDIVTTQHEPKDARGYLQCGYDWLGLGRTVWHLWPYCPRRWVCSTFAAELFNLPNPRGFGVQDLYKWASK